MFQDRFNKSYNQYLVLRGYDPSLSKLIILKRALIDSWGEPGFHRFWQVWNPGMGHLLYRLYLLLGGNRARSLTTMLVFLLCGFLHDVAVMLMFQRPFIAFTTTFFFCGVLTLASRSLESILPQERWSRIWNALINISCLALSISAAVQLQTFFFP